MKLAMYQDCISPHQMPLAKELERRVGAKDFRYVYRDKEQNSRVSMGWDMFGDGSWLCHIGTHKEESEDAVQNADCLISGMRDVELFEDRARRGLKTFYQSERWFKPWGGMLRLLVPSYRRMAERFVRLLDVGGITYLPIGIHAARDMARLCGLMHGDWRCMFRAPELEFERKPGGRIWLKNNNAEHIEHLEKRYCLDKMRMWGYFVEPSKFTGQNSKTENADDNFKPQTQNLGLKTLRVLWVGRLLKLKRVDTIIRAIGELSRSYSNLNLQISLDIYGYGPEEKRLKKLAYKYGDIISFYPPVQINEVRKLMREHDVYVLASNAYEGWGAVVSEALEEGLMVIGTYEAGSSATILPKECLFHFGDWKELLKLLQKNVPRVSIGDWTAKYSSEVLKVYDEHRIL